MLQNAHLVAKIGADTAENEQHFAEILPKISQKLDQELEKTQAFTTWRFARAPPS